VREPVSRLRSDHYKWIALSNTTLGMLAATVNASIVIISLPAIFRGIQLDPLTPGNVSYLLWMLMGYLVVSAVLVVTLGRLGDIYGRVRMYNVGFAVFALGALALPFDPLTGPAGALWLIGFRVIQATGGAMLMANSPAILTDAFPADQRGMAMGINQVAGISGQFIGLILGGILARRTARDRARYRPGSPGGQPVRRVPRLQPGAPAALPDRGARAPAGGPGQRADR